MEIFDKIEPPADWEALGYETMIIQTLDYDRPLDDFLWFFQYSIYFKFFEDYSRNVNGL